MTMLSFRVQDDEAAEIQRSAEALGVDRSEILRDAVHRSRGRTCHYRCETCHFALFRSASAPTLALRNPSRRRGRGHK